MKLPIEYEKQMETLLKEDFPAYIKSFEEERVYGLRVNTSKISVEEFLKISPFTLTPIPWTENGFYYPATDRPGTHPYYYAGLYYLQEPSAMLPAALLPIEENDLVFDGCAAPGGKSSELANKLHNTGILFTNDISNSRALALLRNMERSGCRNMFVLSEDVVKLSNKYPEYFDKILLDVPCSGEGMFRKEPDLITSWIERGNQYYADLQKQIVDAAVKMLKPGGMMVYSTCTFSPLEDEEIILHILRENPEMHVIEKDYPFFEHGFELSNATQQENRELQKCFRLFPHKIKGEGHFAALLQKGEKQETKSYPSDYPKLKLNDSVKEFLQLINPSFLKGYYQIIKDNIYLVPDYIDAKSIRVLRSGLLLGEMKKNHFEPSQTLAMALKESDFNQSISFTSDDIRVHKYLTGDTIDIPENPKMKGWVLVCVDHYPLGFAKAANGTLKNKINSGWRIQ